MTLMDTYSEYRIISLPQQRQIEAQQKPQQEDLGKKLEKFAQLRQKGLLTEEEFQKLKAGHM